MSEILKFIFAILFLAGCVAVLAAIVRFSIISAFKRRGWKTRLHTPNISEVEAKWNVKLPAVVGALYASAMVESAETNFAEPGRSREWHFHGFIPLTVRDLSEWLKITRVPGLPIARDGEAGTYYLPFAKLGEGSIVPVLLRTPNRKEKDTEVASSVEELMRFERRDPPTE